MPGPAKRIEIAAHAERLVPGQRVPLTARVYSAEGDVRPDDSVRWTSTAPGTARVSRGGLLEARGPGKATLTATAGGVRATTAVTSTTAAPASLAIEPADARAKQGDVVRFRLVAKDASGRTIEGVSPSWSLRARAGARSGPTATSSPTSPGTYSVTATLAGRSASAPVTVTRREVHRTAEVVGSVVRKAFATTEVWVHPNGKVAYLGTALGGDRLYTLDVTDPANPRIVDSVQANTRLINDLMTDETGKVMVFTREGASDRKNGIVIATLDDPLHPKVVAEFTEGVTSGVHSAFIYTQPKYGTHVYLTNDGTGALDIVDINDPAHPKLAGTWKTPRADAGRYLHDVAVQDGLRVRELVARRAGHPRRRQGHQGRQSHQSAARLAVQVRPRLALPAGRREQRRRASCAGRTPPGGTAGMSSWATRCSGWSRWRRSSTASRPARTAGCT